MKRVAIVGAGLSGAACAFRLESLGFDGVIDVFEKKRPDEGNVFVELIAEALHRPVKDAVAFLMDEYGLALKPVTRVLRSVNHGPTVTAELYGFQGGVFLRGGHPDSLENQLRRQLRTVVRYGERPVLKELEREYDAVVVAAGNFDYVPAVTRFRIDAHVAMHYAIVGERTARLAADEVEHWLSSRYTPPKGYAYRIPLEAGRAMMCCAGVMEEGRDDIRRGWEVFKDEQIKGKYEVLEEHHLVNYLFGAPEQLRVGNVFLTGTNAGCTNPFYGYGIFNSLLSGVYAADAIARGESYEEKMQVIREEYERGLQLFKRFHQWGDRGYDLIIRAAGTEAAAGLMKAGSRDFIGLVSRLAAWLPVGLEDSEEYLDAANGAIRVEHAVYGQDGRAGVEMEERGI